MSNIIDAYPCEGIVVHTKPLFQWDWGQIVRLHISDLPATYKVEFSNSTRADAVSTVQTTDEVTVPAQFLESGNPVYAWVVVVDEARTTEYSLIIPVSARAKPTDMEPAPEEQTEIEQTLSALNEAISDVQEITDAIQDTVNEVLETAKESGEFDGAPGQDGVTFIPSVSSEGVISWTNDGGKPNPQSVSVKGPKGDDYVLTAADKEEIAQQAEELLVHALDNKAPAIWEDASGAIAHFEDGADDMPLRECVVQIEPVQEGTGDPSSTNVRPITGWTGLTISHSGADITDPDEISITFPIEVGTVYGGTMDMVHGVLTVDRHYWSVDPNKVLQQSSTNGYFWYTTVTSTGIPAIKDKNAKLVSNRLVVSSVVSETSQDGRITFYQNGIIRFKEQGGLSLVEYKAYLESDPLTICYELATPIAYDLTPQEIRTLLGTNNIRADTGDITVTYPADTKLFIEQNAVRDVQINGTSILQDGVANVPLASPTVPGVVVAGTIMVSGATPTIIALPGIQYVCGEVATLDIALPDSGCVDVVFESGSTPTVLSGLDNVRWANGFDPESLDVNTTYEINIKDGLGMAEQWS